MPHGIIKLEQKYGQPTKNRISKLRFVVTRLETDCQSNPGDRELILNRNTARKELNDLLAMEESY